MRRNVWLRKREQIFTEAFQDFCYQPCPEARDVSGIPGISDFPEFEYEFAADLPQFLRGNRPEIYHLIDDHHDGIERAVFDLRTVQRGLNGSGSSASTTSIFLIKLPTSSLIEFNLSRGGLAYAVLWGENPDIEIEGEFVFSKNFQLEGPNKDAITSLFDKALVGFFRANSTLFSSGLLNVKPGAILFRYGHSLTPDEIRNTLDTLMRLISLLGQRTETMHSP